jgi:hypothetical protein
VLLVPQVPQVLMVAQPTITTIAPIQVQPLVIQELAIYYGITPLRFQQLKSILTISTMMALTLTYSWL